MTANAGVTTIDSLAKTDVVQRARAGDAKAFAELAARYRSTIVRWGLTILADPDEAEDLAQHVLLRLQSAVRTFEGRSAFDTWLYRVTRHAALDQLRRKRTGRTALDDALESGPSTGNVTDDWLDRIDTERQVEMVTAFFRDLPPRQREIFDLVDLQGVAPIEVARRLETNPNTVRAHLFRARRTIRERMLQDRLPSKPVEHA